ncbi:MAG: cohesin domain-containing protein, partial [Saprospiraceae bacterium]
LRVTEDRNGNGRIDDGELSNICWTYIRIEDKTPPIIGAPNGDFLCDDPALNDLQLNTGSYEAGGEGTDDLFPSILGGCSGEGITIQLLEVDTRNYDPVCKVGSFTRTFRAVRTVHDNQISGNTIEQTIRVFFNSDWTMTFPADVLVVCDDSADSNLDNVPAPLRVEDIITNRGCDQWGMETNDEIFDIIGQDGDGACFKVVRTYKFINWCTWDPTNTEEGVVPRPLDFFTNASSRVTLDYQSDPVLNICFLQNNIDDRFERNNDPYNLTRFNNFNGEVDLVPAEIDADFIYFDEDDAQGNDAFFGGDCITEGYNAFFNGTIDDSWRANAAIQDDQTHNFVSAEAYGYFIYRQIIKVTDNEAPVIDPIDDFTVCDSTNANGNCTVNVTFPVPAVDECKPTYRVFWQLDANNDGTVDLTGELAGNAVDGFTPLTLNNIPYGTHGFRYLVEDGCGNNSTVDFDFSAMDCKAPTAYCVIGVNIELMPTGMVEVWASDVNAGSFDDCSEPVTLSFSPDPTETSLTFTCDQRGSNFVQLWVTDAAGNQSFCETIINVQSNDTDECAGGGAAIAGGIETEMGDNVEGAEIRLSGATDMTLSTEVDGSFGFEGLVEGSDYTITPEKDVNYLNGVSTFDLVLIRKHIIGTANLDSPYKLIAADVNNSQTITTLDMVTLRKLILNIDTELANNTSWRFVEATYAFPNPANPWMEAFPEVANFNDIQVAANAANFVAVKVGDVNNSATPNMLLGSDERTSNDAVVFNVADAAVAAGEEVTVDFTADMVDVAGYQFTLNFDNNVLDLVEIVEGAATAENFGTTLANEGTITTSFDGEVAADEVLFSLTFAAKASANLSEVISVNSAVTAAEAYKANEVLDVALNFGGATQTAGFELFQNTPNPFNGVTTINFNLPTAASATLTVSDVTGKVLSVINGDYAKGLNQVQFSSNTATGVLYYTLETADFTATKKMIIVE